MPVKPASGSDVSQLTGRILLEWSLPREALEWSLPRKALEGAYAAGSMMLKPVPVALNSSSSPGSFRHLNAQLV
jgi:hypothetical protein